MTGPAASPLELIASLCEIHCGLGQNKWRELCGFHAARATDPDQPMLALESFKALIEARKLDIASARMMIDGWRQAAVKMPEPEVTDDDLRLGISKLLEVGGQNATESDPEPPVHSFGSTLDGTVEIDEIAGPMAG